jgi:hypothetical protein
VNLFGAFAFHAVSSFLGVFFLMWGKARAIAPEVEKKPVTAP